MTCLLFCQEVSLGRKSPCENILTKPNVCFWCGLIFWSEQLSAEVVCDPENYTHKGSSFMQKFVLNQFACQMQRFRRRLEFGAKEKERPHGLSGPLNRLSAILSLLQPLDRYRIPPAMGSAIGRPYLALSCPISHPRPGRSSQPPRSKPLRGLNRAIVVL